MPWLRAIVRLLGATMHLIKGVAIVVLRFPSLDKPSRQRHVQVWSAQLVHLLGIRIEISGEALANRCLLVANHVSWLDIAVVHSCCPQARFVSKADVLRWPLVGRLVRGGGTLFIERERKRDALRVVHQVAQALSEGDCVALFPEGTTGEGHGLLPFHANLLQAAISAEVPVQAVVLRYRDARQDHATGVDVAYRNGQPDQRAAGVPEPHFQPRSGAAGISAAVAQRDVGALARTNSWLALIFLRAVSQRR